MKYLIINGSPHKGNTWKLVTQIKNEIMNLYPKAVFKELHLMNLNLPFCTGCSLCFRKGHEFCPHNTIVQEIINEMEWSDGVIIASTTFNMLPTALMKNMIDHLCFMLHRPYFFTKKALVVSTTAGVGAKDTVKNIAGTLRGLGFNKCYEFPVTSFSWNDYILSDQTKMKCKKIAYKFHNDVSSKKMHRPTWLILIPYNLFRGMSLNYVKGSEYEYADGIHWTEKSRSKSVYSPLIPVPFYKRAFGGLFYRIGKLSKYFFTITYKK